MILLNPCGFNYHHCNVAPAQALVLRLKSLKEGVRPKTKQDSQCESCFFWWFQILRPLFHFYALTLYYDDKIRSILRNHPSMHLIQNY